MMLHLALTKIWLPYFLEKVSILKTKKGRGKGRVAFKIDYHACCNYFNFTFWILQLASDYLTNFFG